MYSSTRHIIWRVRNLTYARIAQYCICVLREVCVMKAWLCLKLDLIWSLANRKREMAKFAIFQTVFFCSNLNFSKHTNLLGCLIIRTISWVPPSLKNSSATAYRTMHCTSPCKVCLPQPLASCYLSPSLSLQSYFERRSKLHHILQPSVKLLAKLVIWKKWNGFMARKTVPAE